MCKRELRGFFGKRHHYLIYVERGARAPERRRAAPLIDMSEPSGFGDGSLAHDVPRVQR
jgi:hypothetical protein